VEVRRAGVHLDPRQQNRIVGIVQIGRLLHDIRPRKIAIALFQYLQHHHSDAIGIERGNIRYVRTGQIFRHECLILAHPWVVL
jgi:hypothetical protein